MSANNKNKKQSRYSITIFGRVKGKDACGGCVNAHKFFKTGHDSRYPITRVVDIDSETGKKAAKKYNINRIPHIQKCRIRRDGTRGKCTSVTGWDASRWQK